MVLSVDVADIRPLEEILCDDVAIVEDPVFSDELLIFEGLFTELVSAEGGLSVELPDEELSLPALVFPCGSTLEELFVSLPEELSDDDDCCLK